MHSTRPGTHHRHLQRGISLVEALVAFAVLSLGMLGAARLQGDMRLDADVARQRAEAVRLAQQDMEAQRAYIVGAAAPGLVAYDDIATGASPSVGSAGTAFQLDRQVSALASAEGRAAQITVTWADRTGAPQQVRLVSMIAKDLPTLGGALALAPAGTPAKGAQGRSARIPPGAKNLGSGRSVLKPVAAGTLAWTFDNRNGLVTAQCPVGAGTTTASLVDADLGACSAVSGLLLAGTVRFAAASPPNAGQAGATPLGMAVALVLSGSGYAVAPDCRSDVVTTGGDPRVSYLCLVPTLPNGTWSGRSQIVPAGWTLGIGSADRKVCRYSADLDGSGAVDTNAEHPGSYQAVDAALLNQNFLVVRGSDACPTGHAVVVAGQAGDVYADLATVQHQP